MSRLKERDAFHIAKKNLSGSGNQPSPQQNQNTGDEPPGGGEGGKGKSGKPPRKSKGGSKGTKEEKGS